MGTAVAAVDLGATSGRVVVARIDDAGVSMSTVHRFPNNPVASDDGLHWNIEDLYQNVVDGLRLALREAPEISSIGVDSWAVDYGLLRGGELLGAPYHYRDARCRLGADAVHSLVSPSELFVRNGLQFLPFNTLYQLATEPGSRLWRADSMLLIPDLITYRLTGVEVSELTNASTTGLLDVRTRQWDLDLIGRLGFPPELFKELVEPGTVLAPLRGDLLAGLQAAPDVVAVGSHDTASAVVGVPMTGRDAAYISCGTWGLVGLELAEPVLTEEARLANFTNEGGVDGRIRFLRNVMGLWMLSESIRHWERMGGSADLTELLERAAAIMTPVATFDVDDPRFLPPGDMPARIAGFMRESGLPVPDTRPELVRCIVESLAEAFAVTVRQASGIAGRSVEVVHLVGGGSLNSLLCQATADRCQLPVLAGPAEATALGNVLVQARATDHLVGDVDDLRRFTAQSQRVARFDPRPFRKVLR